MQVPRVQIDHSLQLRPRQVVTDVMDEIGQCTEGEGSALVNSNFNGIV